jgi:hypothetical protein
MSSYVCEDVLWKQELRIILKKKKGKEKRLSGVIGCRKPFAMLIPLPFAYELEQFIRPSEPECRIDKPLSSFFYFLLSLKQSYANTGKLHRY